MRFAFTIVALACALSTAGAAWTSICQTSTNCPTIMMGISCSSPTLCAIAGGYSNTPMGVYWSTNEFANFTRGDMEGDSWLVMDIATDKNNDGATAGIGTLKNSAILYSKGLKTWMDSTDISFMQGQDINAFGNGEFGYVGTTSTVANTEGVLISSDEGKDWKPHNWPANLANLTQARYGSFPSDQVLYVSGGNWPSSNNSKNSECFQLSHKTCMPLTHLPAQRRKQIALRQQRVRDLKWEQGYFAVLTKSTDGGKTWETQFQDKGSFYFNDVSCIDTTHCTAVGEGFTDGPNPGARIYQTTDGKTWNRVFFSNLQGASMMRVHMVSRTEAWAAGGAVMNGKAMGTFYHTVDGGKTWTLDGSVPFVGDVLGFHFVNSKLGFAVGITEFQTSTIMKYTN